MAVTVIATTVREVSHSSHCFSKPCEKRWPVWLYPARSTYQVRQLAHSGPVWFSEHCSLLLRLLCAVPISTVPLVLLFLTNVRHPPHAIHPPCSLPSSMLSPVSLCWHWKMLMFRLDRCLAGTHRPSTDRSHSPSLLSSPERAHPCLSPGCQLRFAHSSATSAKEGHGSPRPQPPPVPGGHDQLLPAVLDADGVIWLLSCMYAVVLA